MFRRKLRFLQSMGLIRRPVMRMCVQREEALMPKRPYPPKHVEQAHWWLAKAIDTFAEAQALVPSGQTRAGAYNRLYYAAHHIAVALLRLIGNKAKTHGAILNQFGLEWIKQRRFPAKFGALLKELYDDREKADYADYVSTHKRDITKLSNEVDRFLKRAAREIPKVSTAHILSILVDENPEIRDFSFDIYCPKSYFHHTRLSAWIPKGRVSDRTLGRLLGASIKALRSMGVSDARDYVLGLNSRVNQYAEQHLLMLDFDDLSTLPYDALKSEKGFYFRTESGFHFIGSRLYSYADWLKKMRRYSNLASRQHCVLSSKRRYGTLRLTASRRKPVKPAYIGRSKP